MTWSAIPSVMRDGAEQSFGLNALQIYERLSSGLWGPVVVVGQLADCLASFENRFFLLVLIGLRRSFARGVRSFTVAFCTE